MQLALHPLNESFHWGQPSGPFRRITAAQARAYGEDGFFVLEDAFDAETLRAVIDAIDPYERELEAFLRTQKDGRFFIARADEITFTTHLVTRAPLLRDFCAGRSIPGSGTRPDRSGRAAVLGSSGLQEAGDARRVSVASGQRLHLH